jgi:hypothetical protein
MPTHKSQPCKELKMPTLNPPTPADGIFIGFSLNINKNNYHQQPTTLLQDTKKLTQSQTYKRAKFASAPIKSRILDNELIDRPLR